MFKTVVDLATGEIQNIPLTDAELAEIAAAERAEASQRRLVPKSVIISRLTDAQLASARAIFDQTPRLEARWYSPGHAAVYADDPDAVALLKAIGADPNEVMAP